MIRERVAQDVYVFSSELYAQVNAGAVIGPEWSVVIDTLAYPEETKEIRDFVEGRLATPVRYLINTHYHADHSFGSSWFRNAIVVSHARCRDLLASRGKEALENAQRQNRELEDVRLILPDAVFQQGSISLQVGKRTLRLIYLPGHSLDGIGVLVEEDRVLFSGDIMMPVPYLADGEFELMVDSLKRVMRMKLNNLVQGHGDVILRGEVQPRAKDNLEYLANIRRHVRKAARRKDYMGYLEKIDVESCGKSRILLNGLAEELHARNLVALYQHWYGEK